MRKMHKALSSALLLEELQSSMGAVELNMTSTPREVAQREELEEFLDMISRQRLKINVSVRIQDSVRVMLTVNDCSEVTCS